MSEIKLLDQGTINKIAAGEVIDRPASVVKELLENAIDAGATSVTVEIKEGGISFIRITDNGMGMSGTDIPIAFLRHSTSKIKDALDLLSVSSLGFRGEALSSIAAISQIELISKPASSLTGTRYIIEGGKERQVEEIGAPGGTTFIVRNLFYNTPARKKFLKSASTEAAYISNIVERISLSHPDVSIRFINNNSNKLFTSGNSDLKGLIYSLYGKEIASNLLKVEAENGCGELSGYLGSPAVSRGNRGFESFFINGRYIKSNLLSKAVENAYKPYLMQHRYPFAVLHLSVEQSLIDVNVHPAKMEIRFRNGQEIYDFIYQALTEALKRKEHIPEVRPESEPARMPSPSLQPEQKAEERAGERAEEKRNLVPPPEPFETNRLSMLKEDADYQVQMTESVPPPEQIGLFEDRFLSDAAVTRHKILGQAFGTYWLVEYEEKLFIIDQHAAHEKVLYERTLKTMENREYHSQLVSPPMIVTLTMQEEEALKKTMEYFLKIGFEIEHFGGNEYAIRSVPANLFSINTKELFLSILDELSEETLQVSPTIILEKIALMSCKAAVKGNSSLSLREADELIKELLGLDNPYHCPHGRPTIISMTKQELEKKFKRIL